MTSRRCPALRIVALFLLATIAAAPSLQGLAQADRPSRITTFEDLEKAIGQARDAVLRKPKDADAGTRLARLLMMEGGFSEAENTLRAALDADPKNVPAHVLLARLFRTEYRFDAERAELAKADALAPRAEEVLLAETSSALERMDFDAAAGMYKAVAGLYPKSAAALCGLAEVAYWQNKLDESGTYIDRCLAADPGFGRAYLLKSFIHRIRQETDQWKAAGRKAVEVSPFDDEARANLFNILMRGEQKMEEGYAQAKAALRINPLCYQAHNYIGNGWTAVTYGPDQTAAPLEPLLKGGSEALISRDLNRADLAFDGVLKADAKNIKAMIGKGTAAYHRGRFEDALEWFRRALDVNPDYGLAHYGVSQSLLRLKDAINVRLAGIEKQFADKNAPEPPYLGDVFINYAQLDPDLKKIIRLSVKPLRSFLKAAKDKGATFYITPFHMIQSEAPGMEGIRGQRTFDGRLWDDVKGLGGLHALGGEDWERDVQRLRYNVVAHEFTHQVHGLVPKDLRDEVKRLFEKAKKERLTLDFYADFNEFEYFATGVEAYVSAEKLADQKIAYGHTRDELMARDPDLYRLIERLDKQDSR
ncbi:MAG: tetratricopeptide repeat protein [Candidatus Aminicenantales bacterium]